MALLIFQWRWMKEFFNGQQLKPIRGATGRSTRDIIFKSIFSLVFKAFRLCQKVYLRR